MNTVNKDALSKDVVTGCFKINSLINTEHNRPVLAYRKSIRFIISGKRILSISCGLNVIFRILREKFYVKNMHTFLEIESFIEF
jgi:hypothetical protein